MRFLQFAQNYHRSVSNAPSCTVALWWTYVLNCYLELYFSMWADRECELCFFWMWEMNWYHQVKIVVAEVGEVGWLSWMSREIVQDRKEEMNSGRSATGAFCSSYMSSYNFLWENIINGMCFSCKMFFVFLWICKDILMRKTHFLIFFMYITAKIVCRF